MAVLVFAAEMRERALRAPVPMFERASWCFEFTSPSDAKKALGTDLAKRFPTWAVPSMPPDGDAAYDWLETLESGELEADLPDAPDAARRYSRALRAMWNDHVTVAVTPEKKSRVAK
jgi:hypothetical protein